MNPEHAKVIVAVMAIFVVGQTLGIFIVYNLIHAWKKWSEKWSSVS